MERMEIEPFLQELLDPDWSPVASQTVMLRLFHLLRNGFHLDLPRGRSVLGAKTYPFYLYKIISPFLHWSLYFFSRFSIAIRLVHFHVVDSNFAG